MSIAIKEQNLSIKCVFLAVGIADGHITVKPKDKDNVWGYHGNHIFVCGCGCEIEVYNDHGSLDSFQRIKFHDGDEIGSVNGDPRLIEYFEDIHDDSVWRRLEKNLRSATLSDELKVFDKIVKPGKEDGSTIHYPILK